jgi:hypothetical protein
MLDIDNKDFWKGINPGSTITLKDKQSIEDSMEKGYGMKGMDYMVEAVYRLKELNGLAQWNLFLLDDPEERIWVMAKIIEQEIDLRVYFEHPQFEPGNRKDMVDQEILWLFTEPDNPVNFQYNDLKFSDFLEIEEDNEDTLIYRQKGFNEMHCECEILTVSTGNKDTIATIVEYQTKQTCENPELLLFELGGQSRKEGGLIRLMLGCNLRPTEIDVLEA